MPESCPGTVALRAFHRHWEEATEAQAHAEGSVREAEAGPASGRLQLDADVVAPARADMEKKQAEARGRAAKIVEDGKATAAVLTQMIETWKAAGPNARDIFLMQKLQSVLSSLVETIQNVSVDRVAYLPASSQVVQGVQLVEQVKAAFGVDLAKVVARLGAPEEKELTRLRLRPTRHEEGTPPER